MKATTVVSDPHQQISQYDKTRVAKQFGRAAQTYTAHDRLQRLVAAELLQRLRPHSGLLLDIGCGPAHHAPTLAGYSERYMGVDIAPDMLAQAETLFPAGQWLLADMEQLPLRDNAVTTIFSNLAMQWGNDLAGLLNEWLRVVQPEGQILASTVLAGSMWPLGDCFAQLDGKPHHNHWYSAQQVRTELAQFAGRLALTEQCFVVRYPSVLAMLRELKGIGANYTVRSAGGLYPRERFKQLEAAMEQYRTAAGELELHWQIGLIHSAK
ncbi:methyltransferase domain-containing protein [Pseudidiomarina sp. 1APP75-27a]|uniref:methyltransferase domain-containing protein n=1 Tax=Pseudidiomarina terrestris TaxID=2820060 RepID=UPI002B05EB93|nr:methyltransferase domain-containing protein [Pseudidiomarina sp. 1APP75-27a]MEA3587102.1 methyltransferase domain-containing protein [Pseudidiomarina sp. 1APP75-27a]